VRRDEGTDYSRDTRNQKRFNDVGTPITSPSKELKATPSESNTASVFRDHAIELLVDFIHRGNAVTAWRCCGTPARLQEVIRCILRGLIRQCVVILYENGKTSHTQLRRYG
jgi:hypothetical protein